MYHYAGTRKFLSFLLSSLLLFSASCNRATSEYEVQVYGEGAGLNDLVGGAQEMGGLVEYSRMRLYGENLGHGVTGLFGDWPGADGTELVLGSGAFGYPANPTWDRTSQIMTPGFPGPDGADRCITVLGARRAPGPTEYVDVGDRVQLSADGFLAVLPRDPAFHPRPAGESWFVSYASGLQPVLQGHAQLPDNWRSGAELTLSWLGGIPPETATIGAVPYPGTARLTLPTALENLSIRGRAVTAAGPSGEAPRFAGPWTDAMTLTWDPAEPAEPLTLSLRLLGPGEEVPCTCGDDCGAGYRCEEGMCVGEDGASWNQLGELVCHVQDDGEFALEPGHVERLLAGASEFEGVILGVARMAQVDFEMAEVLTHNGKKMDVGLSRGRSVDVIFTRVDVP